MKEDVGSIKLLNIIENKRDDNTDVRKQKDLFLSTSSHAVLGDLEKAIDKLEGQFSEICYLCQACISEAKQTKEIGTFKLIRHFPVQKICFLGHFLSEEDENFFSNIDTNYKFYTCQPYQTIVVLDGALKVECQSYPISFKARICPFGNFNSVVNIMEANNLVSIVQFSR